MLIRFLYYTCFQTLTSGKKQLIWYWLDSTFTALANSINELLDDALGAKQKPTPTPRKSSTTFNLPDLSFLRQNKYSLTSYNWWTEIFDQPSFCSVGGSRTSSVRTCGQCDRKHSTDHHVILFQVNLPSLFLIVYLFFGYHNILLNRMKHVSQAYIQGVYQGSILIITLHWIWVGFVIEMLDVSAWWNHQVMS